MKRQDVIIVGGGPAGSVLSILLARSGLNVTLLEKDTRLDRNFRGPVYQPSAVRIWDEMGVLEAIKRTEYTTFDRFSFVQEGNTLFKMDLSDLPSPYNYIIAVKQAPLLRCLIKEAMRYNNFTYLGGCHAKGLVREEKGTVGVYAKSGNTEHVIEGKLVVAADGRFSTMRDSVGCELERVQQHFDVVWFELPNIHKISFEVGFQITRDGLTVFLPKEEGLIQIGLVLPKGKFPELRKRGIASFIEQIATAKPELKEQISGYLKSWDQCELLDVKIAIAKNWTYDGLMLIGDAAHVASPIGGIGNKLAIEDAAIAHPIIVEALKKSAGMVPKEAIARFEAVRRPDIKKTLTFQKIIGKIVIEISNPIALWLRNKIAPCLQKTPMYHKARHLITMSPHEVHVDKRTFLDDTLTSTHSYHLLEVEKIVEETPSSKTLRFTIPVELKERYRYQAGQFLTLRFLIDGIQYTRCYSLSSGVNEERVTITVKRHEGGVVSTYLNEKVKEGDRFNVLPPAGDFSVVGDKAESFVFFSGGSGITPIYSMIATLLAKNPKTSIHLFYVNHNIAETIFYDKIQKLADTHENFKAAFVLTTPDDPGRQRMKGRPDEERIKSYFKDVAVPNQSYYLCGPKGFMAMTKAVLESEGVRKEFLHEEAFYSIRSIQHAKQQELSDVVAADGDSIAEAPPESVTIDLRGEQYTLDIDKETPILDAALNAGLNAPFSCQEGICGTCRAKLKEGKVEMETHDALTDQEIEEKNILTCQAKLRSRTCHVSYDE